MKRRLVIYEHYIDCFFRNEEDGRELCFLDQKNPGDHAMVVCHFHPTFEAL